MPEEAIDLEKLFCMNSKKHHLPRLLIKAVCSVESSMMPRAKRFEPAFWEKYMKGKPEWEGRDPQEVSSSYGLMQVMYTTAAMFGFSGPGEDLFNPVYNIAIGSAVLRSRVLEAEKADYFHKFAVHPFVVALARYNGGSYGNPDEEGNIRNMAYVRKVFKRWWGFRQKEEDSCETLEKTG